MFFLLIKSYYLSKKKRRNLILFSLVYFNKKNCLNELHPVTNNHRKKKTVMEILLFPNGAVRTEVPNIVL